MSTLIRHFKRHVGRLQANPQAILLDLLQLARPGGRQIQAEQGKGGQRNQASFHAEILLGVATIIEI
ncbi:MAG: hypothetical protein RKO66_17455 [Candidatus Contendobacter sp.]|nr:hypothetical protein [Candidatus Contendobacter sp.]